MRSSWILCEGPKSNENYLYKTHTETQGEGPWRRSDEYEGRDWSDAISQGNLEPQKRQGGVLPAAFRGSTALPTSILDFQPLEL